MIMHSTERERKKYGVKYYKLFDKKCRYNYFKNHTLGTLAPTQINTHQ